MWMWRYRPSAGRSSERGDHRIRPVLRPPGPFCTLRCV